MLVEHRGMRPEVDPSAWAAPTAVLCGDVRGHLMTRQTAWLAAHRDDRVL